MRKIFGYLCNVNKKTRGGLAIFVFSIVGGVSAIVATANDVWFMPGGDLRELVGIGDYIMVAILNMVLLVVWAFVIFLLGGGLYWFWEWLRDDLFRAFKEAAKEDYNYKERKSGTVKFK